MGEASRRKDLVADVRRKIGDTAAQAVAELQDLVKQTSSNHQALAFQMGTFEREVKLAKAAPAELRSAVAALRNLVDGHTEQLENLSARVTQLTDRIAALERPWWHRLREEWVRG